MSIFARTPTQVCQLLTRCIVGAFVAAVVACGNPTIDDRYAGKPLHQATGTIIGLDSAISRSPLRASLFWSPNGRLDIGELARMHEDNSVKIQMEFPSTATISIFKPPKAEWMVQETGYAVGAIVIYEDTVGRGRFIPGRTPIRGGASQSAIFYSPEALHENASPFGAPIGPGMMHLDLPLPCGMVSFPEQTQNEGPTCDVSRVGAPCTQAADCGLGGFCLKSLDEFVFKNGYCSKAASRSCSPVGTVALESADVFDEQRNERVAFLLKACDRDASCRKAEGYACDAFIRGCIPASPIELEVTDAFEFSDLCLKDDESSSSKGEAGLDSLQRPKS